MYKFRALSKETTIANFIEITEKLNTNGDGRLSPKTMTSNKDLQYITSKYVAKKKGITSTIPSFPYSTISFEDKPNVSIPLYTNHQ